MTTNSITFEASAVALVLSSVARLQQAFAHSNNPSEQQKLLTMAGDLLDRTVPFPEVKEALAKVGAANQVSLLIERRERIGFVPPGLWRPSRVRINELSQSNYSGLRALDRALRRDFSAPDKLWPALEEWLAPTWEKHPMLASECQALKNTEK